MSGSIVPSFFAGCSPHIELLEATFFERTLEIMSDMLDTHEEGGLAVKPKRAGDNVLPWSYRARLG